MILRIKAFKNVLEKGQMIVTDIFSFSHDTVYFFFLATTSTVLQIFNLSSSNAYNLDES